MNEHALLFCCDGEQLVGVLAQPAVGEPSSDTALIIVVGGPQYRVGSHRQFALLARTLAAQGYPALRFDARGTGDSSGQAGGFEALDDDIAAAIAVVQERLPGVRQVVLWGLCDGASAALLYLHRRADERVRALCLLNPWVRSAASLAQTHVKHYYLQRLAQPTFWRKLLSGGVARRAAIDLWSSLRLARQGAQAGVRPSFQADMAAAWAAFRGDILLVLSGNDYTAREFEQHTASQAPWRGQLTRSGVTRLEIVQANHTFANAIDRGRVESATLAFLRRVAPLPLTPQCMEM